VAKGEWVHLTAADGHGFEGYRATPAQESQGAIVVVQEIFGVNSHIRGVTERFADAGYTALAPAYFDRISPRIELGYDAEDIARGRELKAEVGYEMAMLDTGAAVARLISEGHKVGIAGYCWGGDIAWLAAADLPVAASVVYYGGGIVNLLDHKPKAPILLNFGSEDHAIPPEAVEKIAAAAPNAPLHLYPAGHGFNCEQRGSYDPESAALAWDRSLAFLRKQLH
jgi:carboxymethylenebutenolidase